jgi:GT2 family glycosyltransferase
MNVHIVIPSYKAPEQLEKCLQAIEVSQRKDDLYWDIQIVDNNEVNRGFTKAINVGLRAAVETLDDYVIALNQDCYLAPDAIVKMVEFMENHTKCAIAGIKQISQENPDQIVCGGVGAAYPFGKHITGFLSRNDCEISRKMPWANGACLIFRVANLLDIGLMDESMFLIGSDSDICYTARARGFEVWYIAEASCIHDQGASGRSASEAVEKLKFKDMITWRDKWAGSELYRELSMEIFP